MTCRCPFDPTSVEVTCDSTQGFLCPSPMGMNTSMYVDTVINFAKLLQGTSYCIHTTYNKHKVQAREKMAKVLLYQYVQLSIRRPE